MHEEADRSTTSWPDFYTCIETWTLIFCLATGLFVSHQKASSSFQPAWGIHSVPTLLHLFIIYSREMGFVTAVGGWGVVGVGFEENGFAKAPCLRPLSPQSWRQGPAELMIRQIYGAISVSHLLPASRRIKGKISGWHWDRDYPVCAIWLHTSTGLFFFYLFNFLVFFPLTCERWVAQTQTTKRRRRTTMKAGDQATYECMFNVLVFQSWLFSPLSLYTVFTANEKKTSQLKPQSRAELQ